MKANLENLIKVVELNAKSHFTSVKHDVKNHIISVLSDNAEVVADMERIADAFFGDKDLVDEGIATTFIDYTYLTFNDEVDETKLFPKMKNVA